MSSNAPSWAQKFRPKNGEKATEFAKRLCDWKYGKGKYDKGPGSDFNQIKKWANRKLFRK